MAGTNVNLNSGSDALTFFESAMSQIEGGLKGSGYEICNPREAQIEWNLNIMQETSKDGGINLKIVNAGVGKSNQAGQGIKVYARKIGAGEQRLHNLEKEEVAKERGRQSQKPLF